MSSDRSQNLDDEEVLVMHGIHEGQVASIATPPTTYSPWTVHDAPQTNVSSGAPTPVSTSSLDPAISSGSMCFEPTEMEWEGVNSKESQRMPLQQQKRGSSSVPTSYLTGSPHHFEDVMVFSPLSRSLPNSVKVEHLQPVEPVSTSSSFPLLPPPILQLDPKSETAFPGKTRKCLSEREKEENSFGPVSPALNLEQGVVGVFARQQSNSFGRKEEEDDSVESRLAQPKPLEPILSKKEAATTTVFPAPSPSDDGETEIKVREARPGDARSILEMTKGLDMHNATSFVWPEEELKKRIATRTPLVMVAIVPCSNDEGNGTPPIQSESNTDEKEEMCHEDWMEHLATRERVVGVAGIDVQPTNAPYTLVSMGAHVVGTEEGLGLPTPSLIQTTLPPAGKVFDVPSAFCSCRGLLIDPDFQGLGIGSLLHAARIMELSKIRPNAPSILLSARGNTLGQSQKVLQKFFDSQQIDNEEKVNNTQENTSDVHQEQVANCVIKKKDVLKFTYKTSAGVVHLAHGKEEFGWYFIGLDEADGGPTYCTAFPLTDVAVKYEDKRCFTKSNLFSSSSSLPPSGFSSLHSSLQASSPNVSQEKNMAGEKSGAEVVRVLG